MAERRTDGDENDDDDDDIDDEEDEDGDHDDGERRAVPFDWRCIKMCE